MKTLFKKILTKLIPWLLKMLLPPLMELLEKEVDVLLNKQLRKMATENTKSLNAYKQQLKKDYDEKTIQ